MTAPGVIAPLLPRSSTGSPPAARSAIAPAARGPLPLVDLPSQRTSAVIYGASAVDDRGRVVDRVALRTLGWPAGHRLSIEDCGGTLTVTPDPAGEHQVTGRGFLRLPASLRYRWGLTPGDRVILAADPDRCRLAIYSPAALDAALAHPPTTRPGGDPA